MDPHFSMERENPSDGFMERVAATMERTFPDEFWDDFSADLVARGFFGVSLADQVKAYVRLALERCGRKADRIFQAFLDESDDRMGSLAAETVWQVWNQEPGKALARLKKLAKKDGPWSSFWTSLIIHRLVCAKGVEELLFHLKDWLAGGDAGLQSLALDGLRVHHPLGSPCRELAQQPDLVRQVVEAALREEDSRVRSSLAKVLHDVCRSTPAAVLGWVEQWVVRNPGLRRHPAVVEGLRGPLAAWNPRALDVLGFRALEGLSWTWVEELPEQLRKNQVYRVKLVCTNSGKDDVGILVGLRLVQDSAEVLGQGLYQGDLGRDSTQIIEGQFHFPDTQKSGKERGEYTCQIVANGHVVLERAMRYQKMKNPRAHNDSGHGS